MGRLRELAARLAPPAAMAEMSAMGGGKDAAKAAQYAAQLADLVRAGSASLPSAAPRVIISLWQCQAALPSRL